MFPNLRLMIIAIMASILGMSCALGVFAVFGVKRDPILRLPSAAPPLPVFSNAAPVALSASVGKGTALAPFDTRFTVTLPTASVAPAERSIPVFAPALTAGAESVGPAPSKVNTVMAVAAEPRETGTTEHGTKTDEAPSADTIANSAVMEPEATSTEVTKPEATTADVTSTEVTKPEATSTEVTKPEATTADVTSTEVTKPEATSTEVTKLEATTADVTSTEVRPDGASALTSGNGNRAVPTVASVVQTSATEQSSPSSISGEKTVRPASAKVRAKTVRTKAHASTDSAKVRTKTARTRVVHTAVKSKHVGATPRMASPDGIGQYADPTFAAQPVY